MHPRSSPRRGHASLLLLLSSLVPAVVSISVMARRDGARFTFYDTGEGACGGYNEPDDFIVALNAEQWDGGAHCGQMITISCGGKQTEAQIVDLCPSCPYGALDFSLGLFSFFASPSNGMIFGDWHFGLDTSPASFARKPTPTPTPEPEPEHGPKSTRSVSKDTAMRTSTAAADGNSYSGSGARESTRPSSTSRAPESASDATPAEAVTTGNDTDMSSSAPTAFPTSTPSASSTTQAVVAPDGRMAAGAGADPAPMPKQGSPATLQNMNMALLDLVALVGCQIRL